MNLGAFAVALWSLTLAVVGGANLLFAAGAMYAKIRYGQHVDFCAGWTRGGRLRWWPLFIGPVFSRDVMQRVSWRSYMAACRDACGFHVCTFGGLGFYVAWVMV